MRFTIKREEFDKALGIASRAVAIKNPVAVLQNLKLDLTEDGLSITGSNYDLTIRTTIPYKNGEDEIIRNYKEGSVLLNSKIITEIARKMEADELTLEVIDSTIASIGDKRSEYKLNCIRAEEYPDLDLEPDGETLKMTSADFNLLVGQTAFAASVKDNHATLIAVNLDAEDGILTATATDSARLARKILPIPGDVSFNANVPAKLMVEVAHLIEGQSGVDIAVSDKKALFTFGKTLVATRLVAGDYPNTKNIVPKMNNYLLEVNAQDFLKAIERANILSIDRENVVDLSMSSEGINVSAKSSQVGSAVETIDVFRYEGEPLKVSFNSGFVTAAIRALGSEDVAFGFVGEMKPFVIKNLSDDSVVQVVTPVRTY